MPRLRVIPTSTGDLIVLDDMPSIIDDPVLETDWAAARETLREQGYGVLYFDFPVEVQVST